MKRCISVIITLFMIFAVTVPCFGAEAESEEIQRVLLLIKSRIGSTDDYEKFHSSSSMSEGKAVTYNFSWSSDDRGMDITATPDGIITSYYLYDRNKKSPLDSKPTINKISSDEAIVKTKELLRALNPDIADDIYIYKDFNSESLYDIGYSFSVQRMYNGIDVVGNSGSIRVGVGAEYIESFYLNYTQNMIFDSSDDITDVAVAKENFKSQLGMKLQYVISSGKATLEYIPDKPDFYIRAEDGEAINPIEPGAVMLRTESAKDSAMVNGALAPTVQLSEAEIKNLEDIDGLLSAEYAEKTLRQNEALDISDDMEVTKLDLYHNGSHENYTYAFTFRDDKSDVNANINARTGDLVSFWRYYDKFTTEKAENPEIACKYAEILAPKHYKTDNSLEYRYDSFKNGYYEFVRYVNDIECAGNRIYIVLNPENKLMYYSIDYAEAQFDSPDGILTHSQACDVLFDKCGYKLYYYPSCSTEELRYADRAVLIYNTVNENNVIDAKTGEIKYTHDQELHVGNYTDIQGHYAENVITELARYGIGFAEEEFRPDNLITCEEFAILVTSALIGNESIVLHKSNMNYSYYLERASSDDVIPEEDRNKLNENITREKAAVYMIRALRLNEVASLDGIYISKFNDVTKYMGHIAILNAMGVINGYDGKFTPDGNLTRADAMIMLYNYLSI